MTEIFYDSDADLSIIKEKVVAILGYGNQGRAQALNMRDNGCRVLVGNKKDEHYDKARRDGFEVLEISDAAREAEVICVLLPDEVQPSVFKKDILSGLSRGKLLDFASGFTVFSRVVVPPKDVDVVMVAPKMIGEGVRDLYLRGLGAPAVLGVHRDFSGNAWNMALGIAKAIGCTRAGVVKSTFEEEAVTDLFNEQTVAFLLLLKTAFEILTEAGYDPIVTQLELYGSGEWLEVIKAMLKYGIFGQGRLHSTTSQYGQLSRGPRIVNQDVKKEMRKILEEIRSGGFAEEWFRDVEAGYPELTKRRNSMINNALVKAEQEVRERIRIPPLS